MIIRRRAVLYLGFYGAQGQRRHQSSLRLKLCMAMVVASALAAMLSAIGRQFIESDGGGIVGVRGRKVAAPWGQIDFCALPYTAAYFLGLMFEQVSLPVP